MNLIIFFISLYVCRCSFLQENSSYNNILLDLDRKTYLSKHMLFLYLEDYKIQDKEVQSICFNINIQTRKNIEYQELNLFEHGTVIIKTKNDFFCSELNNFEDNDGQLIWGVRISRGNFDAITRQWKSRCENFYNYYCKAKNFNYEIKQHLTMKDIINFNYLYLNNFLIKNKEGKYELEPYSYLNISTVKDIIKYMEQYKINRLNCFDYLLFMRRMINTIVQGSSYMDLVEEIRKKASISNEIYLKG